MFFVKTKNKFLLYKGLYLQEFNSIIKTITEGECA